MKAFSELTSASQVNNEDLLAISQTSGSGYASKKTTVKDITDKSNLNLAEEYDSTSTYAVDDYVIYEGVLYKCIATTTGAFDSTKWTSVVVTDEMGSGGGGGTGGHTIIDENGNSMTARAGLQFVGADVSDDGTNNKTIVDLASAGGIDGVFIDTDNIIVSRTQIPYIDILTFSYTATEDCFFYGEISNTTGSGVGMNIDGQRVMMTFGLNQTQKISGTYPLKKGQTVTFFGQPDISTDIFYIVYGIQTGTTHSKFQPVIYSLEEREIGVWTDGKPLYEKTFVLSSTVSLVSNGWTEITEISKSGIEQIVSVTGYGDSSSNGYLLDGLFADTAGTTGIRLLNPRSTNTSVKTVTLQYTKSTDTVGSGSWTPQGVPTHHYSENEQVIGTWIDGKTLYEKTINFGALPNADSKSVTHNISNLDTIVSYEAITQHQSSGTRLTLPDLYTASGTFYFARVRFDSSNIIITATTDRSDYTKTYITLKYTKSS